MRAPAEAAQAPGPVFQTAASCPVCGGSASTLYALGRDRLFGLAAGIFPLYRCTSCRCTFQHPMPDAKEIPSFYPPGYWWAEEAGPGRKISRLLSRLERIYREAVVLDHVRFLEKCALRTGSPSRLLLDIGCGNGTFLHLAQRRGFVAHGMDMSPRAVEVARERYGLQVREGGIGSPVWRDLRFDFVTMFHLLEHLPNPAGALRYAKTLLKPGGGLIVQVPNIASLQARLFRERWYGLDVPRHLINFSPEGLGMLLERAGYEILAARRFSFRDNPASIASSLAPALDPIGRKGRGGNRSQALDAASESAYFALVIVSLPFALLESFLGRGGTLWLHARCVIRDSKCEIQKM